MKGALERNQILAVAGGVVLVLVAGALAWLGLGAVGEKLTEAEALAEKMGNPALAALLADSGGVARADRESAEMRKIEKELQEGVGARSGAWGQATSRMSGEGEDWARDPGKWKDRLISIQSDLQKEAPKKKVRLAPDFYLGLEAFRQKSPTPDQVPGLALHLAVAEHLVRLLMKARETAEQYPTVCEFRSLSGPGSNLEREGEAPPPVPGPKAAAPPQSVEREKFRLEFRCSPEVLYEYVRLLSRDSALLILTQLSVTNEKQSFPPRSEIAKKFVKNGAAVPAGTAETPSTKKRLLEILAGEESVLAQAEVEFVLWKNPEGPKPPPAGGAKP